MPTLVSELDTPAVVIDLDIVEANIKRAQDILASHRLNNRPHIKTHKIPALAKKQIEAGAVGITCQKLGEVEVIMKSMSPVRSFCSITGSWPSWAPGN